MRERAYQTRLIQRLKLEFPGCVVIENDPKRRQGLPDLIILFNDRWAMLEVKASEGAPVQPNQKFYVQQFGEMSYSSFIYPENERQVLIDLSRALNNRRETRVSQSK